jgi:predicted nucleic acid-binding protein
VIAYIDSSALMKLYLDDEAGVEGLQEVVDLPASLVTSRLAYVEVRAALASARRAGRLTAGAHDVAVGAFEQVWSGYDVIEINATLGSRAAEVAEQYGLRAGDAIHLASALEIGDEATVVVVWDGRLRVAAAAAGLAVFPSR